MTLERSSENPEKMSSMRLIRALAGVVAERPPIWLMRQAGRYLPEYRALRAKAKNFLDFCYRPELAVEATLQPIRRFGLDAAILFSDILVVPDALGQQVEFREGEGPALEPVRTRADIERLTFDADRLAPVYETVSRLRADLPGDVALIGFAGAPWTVTSYMVEGHGSKDFAAARLFAYREPESFGRLIGLVTEATVRHLSAQIEAGANAVQIFDSWAGALSEPHFRLFCLEQTRRIAETIQKRHPGVPIIGFPRGAGSLIADYAASTGVDAVSLDTGVALKWACENIDNSLTLQGNLDPLAVVSGGATMRAEAQRILESMRGRPFIFNLGHGLIPETPPDHVAALCALVRDWR